MYPLIPPVCRVTLPAGKLSVEVSDLILRCLDVNWKTRMPLEAILNHPWFTTTTTSSTEKKTGTVVPAAGKGGCSGGSGSCSSSPRSSNQSR